MKTYNNPNGIRRAIAETLNIPIEEVELAYNGNGFTIVRPEGAEPDEEAVSNWTPPVIEPEPVDPVKQLASVFSSATKNAQEKINLLKAECCAVMVSEGFTHDEAVAAGVAFAISPKIKLAIENYELAGGHPIAAGLLLQAVQNHEAAWVKNENVMAVFVKALS